MVGAAAELTTTAASQGWAGPDPYDGLWWGWPAVMKGGRRRRQMIVQLHARSPVDVRVFYRSKPPAISKALGVFGEVAARLSHMSPQGGFPELARKALDPLLDMTVAGGSAWGYPWDVQTRWSFYPAGSPNVVATAYAARGLAAAGRALEVPRYEAAARKAAEWALRELYDERGGFFAYHPGSDALIHNANLLGARLVHDLHGDDPHSRTAVLQALELTLAAQRDDGSWPYGADANVGFVDGFHTGYVLTCLCALRDLDPAVDDAIARGARYWTSSFFDREGRAMLWPNRPYPEDGHAAGTALTTFAALAAAGHRFEPLFEDVQGRLLARGLSDGHAVHRRYRLGRTRVSYIRWCDAHVALGLVDAAESAR